MGFLGGLIGYWLWGWPGAILGYFILRFFGRGFEKSVRENYDLHSHGSEIFFDSLFKLLGHLAKADGRVSEEEIAQAESVMHRMGIRGEKREQAIQCFRSGSSDVFNLDTVLVQIAAAARFRPDLKRHLLVFLVEMAMADGQLDSSEEQMLRTVAKGLHIDLHSFEQMLEMLKAQHAFSGAERGKHQENELAQAYAALGASADMSDKEVKRAYRKLMSQYHPDKMIAKGVPEDMLAVATEKAQEIQAAYDVIEKSRK